MDTLTRALAKVRDGYPLTQFSTRCLYLLDEHFTATHNPLLNAVHRELITRSERPHV